MECASILMERGDWSSINESNFMENIFIDSSLSNMVGCDNGSYYTTDTTDSNCYSVSQYSQESLYSESSDDVAYQNHENYILSDHDQFFAVNNNGSSLPVEFCLNTNGVIQVFPRNFMDRNHSFNNNVDDSETYVTQNENFEVHAKYEMVEIEPVEEVKSNDDLLEVGCKRSRKSEVQKGKRNARSKKSRKLESDELQNCPSLEKQNSGNCSNEELLNGNKTRASRGAATDPQSLYARKRRERINEKLRTLQKLVPNGTKVDLSTMLEEAVSYVKFLQLQIKLLSSDDLWMYAPLAYNGMDIGLDSKLNSLLQ